jgi:hypothetical protein
MCFKAASCTQGGAALMWKEDDLKFEVELVLFNNGLNILTFQLITGDEQFYVVGVYIPLNCTRGVADLQRAGEACLAGCKLLVMGDLNVNVGFPQDKREEVILDLLDVTNLANTFGSGLRAGLPPGHGGHGVRNAGRRNIIHSRIISWHAQWKGGFLKESGSVAALPPLRLPRHCCSSLGGMEGPTEAVPAQAQEISAVPAARAKGCGHHGIQYTSS